MSHAIPPHRLKACIAHVPSPRVRWTALRDAHVTRRPDPGRPVSADGVGRHASAPPPLHLRVCWATSGGAPVAHPHPSCDFDAVRRRATRTCPHTGCVGSPSEMPMSHAAPTPVVQSAADGVGRHASTSHARSPACALADVRGCPCRTPSAVVSHTSRQEVGMPHDPAPRVRWTTLRGVHVTRRPDPGRPVSADGVDRHASTPPAPPPVCALVSVAAQY